MEIFKRKDVPKVLKTLPQQKEDIMSSWKDVPFEIYAK